MPDPVKQLYDYFSPENPGLGNLDDFKSSLQDSSKRKEFYESLEDDEPETYSEFDR